MKAKNKNILRTFASSKTRVLSIFVMVLLAAMVVTGLGHSGRSMRLALNERLEDLEAHDVKVSSPYGLSYEDQAILEGYDKNANIAYTYELDAKTKDGNIIKLISQTQDGPGYRLMEGRLPEEKGEIALDYTLKESYKLGDTVDFESLTDDKLTKSLTTKSYQVVGYVSSYEYLMENMRGISLIGKTDLNGYGLIEESNFKLNDFSAAYIAFPDLDSLAKTSDEYLDLAEEKRKDLEDSFKTRPGERLASIKAEALDKLGEEENKIDQVENDLADAKKKIEDGYKDLEEGYNAYYEGKEKYDREVQNGQDDLARAKKRLDDAKAKIDSGQKDLDRKTSSFQALMASKEEELNKGKKKLVEARVGLDEAKASYEKGLAQLDQGFLEPRKELEETKAQLDAAKAEIDKGWEEIRAVENMPMAETNKAQDPGEENKEEKLEEKIDQEMPSDPPNPADLEKAKAELREKEDQYKEGLKAYEEGLAQLEEKYQKEKTHLDEAKKEIDKNEALYQKNLEEVQAGEKELEKGKREGWAQINQGKKDLDNARASYALGLKEYEKGQDDLAYARARGEDELKSSYTKLLDSERELEEANKKYEEESQKGRADIDKGKKEIKEAKDNIFSLSPPNYSFESLDDNVAINIYRTNSLRMDTLSLVFPFFFYLVAMLVTVTTIQRMIEEERGEMGSLKSLGFTRKEIFTKYLAYGLVPTILASILGTILGVKLITKLIVFAYSQGFDLGLGRLDLSAGLIALTMVASIGLILLTIYLAASTTIKESPASLLAPKAPKAGSRVFLERITPIWDRMSFLHKITARNIFRYKARMFMTIFGVAGSTALIFFGFSLKGSIIQYADLQFKDIMKYDMISIYDEEGKKEDLDSYKAIIKDEKTSSVNYQLGKVGKEEVNLVVAENLEALDDFVSLRTKSGEDLSGTKDGVIITEKLAKLNKVKPGDELKLEDSDGNIKSVEVADIGENYFNHYIYMDKAYYEKAFDKDFVSNGDYIISQDPHRLEEKLMDEKAVLSLINIWTISSSTEGLLDALDLVIGVIILISSILAIVVLYNLTNVNICERMRELSTIKVLGFYPEEVTAYIYRESFVLTLLGIVFGYVLGRLMYNFIIKVVAPPSILLVDHIQAKSYIISAAITLVISLIVMLIVHKRLKKIDMVEALKAND